MNIKHTISAFLTLVSTFTVSAVTITLSDITPGSLSSSIVDPADVTDLVITSGAINAADMEYINSLPELRSLDLSGASIAAYKGDPVLYGRTQFNADILPSYAFAGMKISNIVLPSGITSIGDGALSSSHISSISIPASVTEIGTGAFSNCNYLVQVTIPSTVRSIGQHAFSRCDNLESVIWKSVDIPEQAFTGCGKLSSFTVAGATGLTSIGDNAFNGCTSLASFPFSSTLKSIGNSAFESSGLVSVDMSNATSLTSVGAWAFAKCDKLVTVDFGQNITQMGQGIFFEDPALVTFRLPDGVDRLPDYIFKGDVSLDTTNLVHYGVKEIGNYALKDMSQVETFTLPASLQSIGDEAMSGWNKLHRLTARSLETPPTLGTDVFKGSINEQEPPILEVENDMAEVFTNADDQWKQFRIDVVSGKDDIEADKIAAAHVKAWFSGKNLHIRADIEIANAVLLDLNGRPFVSAKPGVQEFIINTADFTDNLYLLRLDLVDGTPAVVKIAR